MRLRYFFLLIIQFNDVLCSFTNASMIYAGDLPTVMDLPKYLDAIVKIVDHSAFDKNKLDIQLAFGLFMSKLNLKKALYKRKAIPVNVKNKIKNIINVQNEIINYFYTIYSKNEESRTTLKQLMSLFDNPTYWEENLEPLTYTAEEKFTPEQLTQIYSPYDEYLEIVDHYLESFPTPFHSDKCMAILSENAKNFKEIRTHCTLINLCYDMLKQGTNFGYALTHRLLFLLMARFGRRCIVFSEQSDRALAKQFCSLAHAEATYLAQNNYEYYDLFMEIIGLCTMDGHAQFLHRTWLDNILALQTPAGCYNTVSIVPDDPVEISFLDRILGFFRDYTDPKDTCRGHTTGLAAVTFSAAVRFILEQYY